MFHLLLTRNDSGIHCFIYFTTQKGPRETLHADVYFYQMNSRTRLRISSVERSAVHSRCHPIYLYISGIAITIPVFFCDSSTDRVKLLQ